MTARLDREWAVLRRSPQALRRARSWADLLDPELAGHLRHVDDLDQVIEATHAGRADSGEALIRALIAVAADDQLAGRLLLQRLLPGVLSATVRYRRLCDHDDPIGEALGALWIAIATFDVERRRGPAAPSIISDTVYLAFRQRLRRRSADEQPIAPASFDDAPSPVGRCALLELADIVGTARRAGVPTHDLDLIRQLVRAESPGLVARQRQVTPRTVRNHRDRAVERIREATGIEVAA